MEMSEFDALEARLKPNRSGALRKIGDRILALEKLRVWMVGTGVIGAFVAAGARAVEGTPGIVMVFTGAAVAAIGGLFVALFDFRKLELSSFLTEAESIAESAIDAGRSAQTKLDKLTQDGRLLERRRLALIDANVFMREALEQTLLVPAATQDKAIDAMLEAALLHILVAVDFAIDESWAISVFQVQGDELVRIVAKRARRADEQKDSRKWKQNEGLVGTAWALRNDVIVSGGPEDLAPYLLRTPDNLRREYDADRYRSMAAVPVRLGHPAEIWGVIAVSSDRAGRFRPISNGDRQEQAVDTVRLIARMTALAVAGFRRGA
jgi:hypothetical protein